MIFVQLNQINNAKAMSFTTTKQKHTRAASNEVAKELFYKQTDQPIKQASRGEEKDRTNVIKKENR